MGFSYTFIHTDINQRIPKNWALRELYWEHSEVKGDVLENPKNKVWRLRMKFFLDPEVTSPHLTLRSKFKIVKKRSIKVH